MNYDDPAKANFKEHVEATEDEEALSKQIAELQAKLEETKGKKKELYDKSESEAINENMMVDAKNENIERAKKLEEDALTDKTESSAKAEEILKQINGDSREQKEKSPEEKMDDYIAKFKKIGGEHGNYNLMFQSMRDDKSIDFLNNDNMMLRFIKGMGNIDAIQYLNAYVYPDKKKISKEMTLKIIEAIPEGNSPKDENRYGELHTLAMKANLEKDRDVIEAIAWKNRMVAASMMGNDYRAAHVIITEGPDAYFKNNKK